MITKIDAMGDPCPIPVVKTKKALKEIKEGGTLEVSVDNSIAVQNLTKMATQLNIPCSSEKISDSRFVVTLTVEGDTGEKIGTESAKTECIPYNVTGNSIVVISSSKMGEGSDELGATLMKGFIYALSASDKLPATVLFYNGGVKLAAEGSDSLQDLKSLEAQGVEILSCGTCLNFYGLTEKLGVGGITNMYAIVEKMMNASSIVKPS